MLRGKRLPGVRGAVGGVCGTSAAAVHGKGGEGVVHVLEEQVWLHKHALRQERLQERRTRLVAGRHAQHAGDPGVEVRTPRLESAHADELARERVRHSDALLGELVAKLAECSVPAEDRCHVLPSFVLHHYGVQRHLVLLLVPCHRRRAYPHTRRVRHPVRCVGGKRAVRRVRGGKGVRGGDGACGTVFRPDAASDDAAPGQRRGRQREPAAAQAAPRKGTREGLVQGGGGVAVAGARRDEVVVVVVGGGVVVVVAAAAVAVVLVAPSSPRRLGLPAQPRGGAVVRRRRTVLQHAAAAAAQQPLRRRASVARLALALGGGHEDTRLRDAVHAFPVVPQRGRQQLRRHRPLRSLPALLLVLVHQHAQPLLHRRRRVDPCVHHRRLAEQKHAGAGVRLRGRRPHPARLLRKRLLQGDARPEAVEGPPVPCEERPRAQSRLHLRGHAVLPTLHGPVVAHELPQVVGGTAAVREEGPQVLLDGQAAVLDVARPHAHHRPTLLRRLWQVGVPALQAAENLVEVAEAAPRVAARQAVDGHLDLVLNMVAHLRRLRHGHLDHHPLLSREEALGSDAVGGGGGVASGCVDGTGRCSGRRGGGVAEAGVEVVAGWDVVGGCGGGTGAVGGGGGGCGVNESGCVKGRLPCLVLPCQFQAGARPPPSQSPPMKYRYCSF
eukprot:Rhum_TRINITY_DN12467_c0_g1::Rhum_TRINITY_DN12467_c0_g1_i1::g.52085::m.52085